MIAVRIVLLLIFLAACQTTQAQEPPRAADVQRAFIASYFEGNPANVVHYTMPITIQPESLAACGADLSFPNIANANRSSDLRTPLAGAPNVRFVDPREQSEVLDQVDVRAGLQQGLSIDEAVDRAFAAGWMNISEVTFDTTGNYALLEYTFTCGSMCGNGGSVIMRRSADGRWARTNRRCGGGWVS